MIQRLYINNFRCLENFDISISGIPSSLLIGKNGTGKSTVGEVLQILQRIANGTYRVSNLVRVEDIGRSDGPVRFDIEVLIHDEVYCYNLTLNLLPGFNELRVTEERLSQGDNDIFVRCIADTGHLVALPLIQQRSESDPLYIFKNWLARMLILAPIPSRISGESVGDTLRPNKPCSNFAKWFTGLLAHSPSAHTCINKFIHRVMPDIIDIQNPEVGEDSHSLIVQFQRNGISLNRAFKNLSDGEKCYLICAAVLASNTTHDSIFCFWDEPDNYISLDEVGQFVMALRRSFQSRGQLLVTSHHPEAIRRFSTENTFLLHQSVRPLTSVPVNGNLVNALIRGDLV